MKKAPLESIIMAKPKIVLITESLNMGGAEKIIASLAHYLAESESFEVSVISFYNSKDDELLRKLEADNIRIVFLNKCRGLDLSFWRRLRRELSDLKPDIIHTHFANHLKYILPLRGQAKIIHTLHNDFEMNYGKAKTAWYFCLFKHLSIVPVNIASKINRKFNRLPDSEIIMNGIELDKMEKAVSFPDQIVNVGRLENQKNQRLLLHAFYAISKKIKTAKLLIVGTGEKQASLIRLCQELIITEKVEFLGHRKDIKKMIASSSLFIQTSKWEGLPLVLIEALRGGCPVVATNVGGTADIIDDSVGRLAELDAVDIAKKAIEILSDSNLASEMSDNGKKRAKNFSAENMAQKYIKLYQRLLQ